MARVRSKVFQANEGGRVLALEIQRRDITQAQAEALLEASSGIVCRLISGERKPGRALSQKLKATFGIDPGAWDKAPRGQRTGTDG